MPKNQTEKVTVTIQFPRKLWKDFSVYVKVNDTTASREIRNFIRKLLGRTDFEE